MKISELNMIEEYKWIITIFQKMTYLTFHRIFLRARGKIIKARNVSHATIEHQQPSESHKRDFDARNNV